MDDAQLEQLENWAQPLLERMEPAARKTMLRELSRGLRRRQAERIKSQRNPDGSSYEKRRPRRKVLEMDFTYRGKDGEVTRRRARLRKEGGNLHGHDELRGAFRTFKESRILAVHSRSRVRAKVRSRMLLGMAKRRILQAAHDEDTAAVGYRGVAARIARTHQHGKEEEVVPGGPTAQYPQRQLLGLTDDDVQWIRDQLFQHLTE